jgi:hypothetical protein
MSGSAVCLCGSLLLAVGTLFARGEAADPKERFKVILDRNPFQLKPPPEPIKPVEPVKPPDSIKLSGFRSYGEKKKVMLVRMEPGNPKPEYLTLSVGEMQSGVELLEANEVTGEAKIKNGGITRVIDFKSDGMAAGAAPAPGIPGAPPGPLPTAFQQAPPPPTSVFAPKPGTTATPRVLAPATSSGSIRPTSTVKPTEGLQNIPTRTLRVNPGQPQSNAQPPPAANVNYPEQIVKIEVNRVVQPEGFPPFPPTELTPNQ